MEWTHAIANEHEHKTDSTYRREQEAKRDEKLLKLSVSAMTNFFSVLSPDVMMI